MNNSIPRKALLIGIDQYDNFGSLTGCIEDVKKMTTLLEVHSDGTENYQCRALLGVMEDGTPITRAKLREASRELFGHNGEIILYFSGHGAMTQEGGFLATSDAAVNDYGVKMDEILQMAIASKAKDILLIVDACHSGDLGNAGIMNTGRALPLASLRENMTVIAASRNSEAAGMVQGQSLFTAAVLDALGGGSADHMGWVTAPSIYAYVERRFGVLDQRPVYKSHTATVSVIRQCAPLIDRCKLRELVTHFPDENYKYILDPEHEPEDENGNLHEPVNQTKIDIALLFKEYRDAGLLKPSDPKEQLYWTARRNHTVELTGRGKEYWRLVKYNII